MSSGSPPGGAAARAAFAKVDPWFDIVRVEHGVLALWRETGAFERLREKNRGKPVWSFLDGPITANNKMGVHHAWGRTLKDAYQRFWAMRGRELRYQNGFDCQGLWVEVEVEKEHGFASKRQIEEYGIARFVEDCKARVRKFSAIQTEQSIRLGMWMDWDHSYYTMSDENNYTIWSFLKRCHGRGKIYRGHDVVPWSGRSGSSYSQMEVIEGRRLVTHTAVFVRFPLRGRPRENLLVWTTTPWTLAANVAAAVNVDLEYVKLRSKRDGQLYYFAAENLKFQRLERQFEEKREWIEGVPKLKTIHQIFEERGGYEIEGVVKGAELAGLEYDGPFDEIEAQGAPGGHPVPAPGVAASARQAHRVIDGGRDSQGNAIVVLGEGTGIVHIAPGCGDVDHVIGKAQGLPQIAPLDEAANFVEGFGFLTGRNATDRALVDEILASLREKGLLVASETYPHVYPHCWRSGDELVFRMVDEWYIAMDWREEILRTVDDIRWFPPSGRDREVEWLTNMRDWMISKKRYWGLALPIWVCEACDTFDVIGGREELRARAVEGWEAFEGHSPHRPWIDAVKIACPACGGRMSRIPDVGNPWLDAGIVPYSTMGWNTDRADWERWFPADLVLESLPGQYRNWFYALLAMSAMMTGRAPFKNLVGHALVRDEHGEEMHKSKGNAIWFDDAAEQAGADCMRWLYVRQDPVVNLNFGYGPLKEVRGKFINTLWNTYAFFVNYARLEGFVPGERVTPFAARPDFDRWILTELQRTVTRCRAAFEGFQMRQAALAIEEFVERLSNWYVRHSRARFWKTGESAAGPAAFETLFECLETLIRLMAPLTPFLTEAIYQNLVRSVDSGAPVSVHLLDYPEPDPGKIDDALAADMEAIIRLNSLALSAREARKIKVRQPLATLTIGPKDDAERRAAERFREMLREDLNVKTVEITAPGTPSPVSRTVRANFKTLGKRLGPRMKAAAAAIEAEAGRLAAEIEAGADEFRVEAGGEAISLERVDLRLEIAQPPELAVAENAGTWAAFDTRLTDDLRLEGTMRDLLRRLQMMRKEIGLEIEDRIRLRWAGDSPVLTRLFEVWGRHLAQELLCLSLERAESLDAPPAVAITLDGAGLRVEMSKGH